MGSPSSGTKGVWKVRADHLELEQAMCRGIRSLGRCASMGAQHSGDARREETLSSLDPIRGAALPGLVALSYARGIPLVPRRAP